MGLGFRGLGLCFSTPGCSWVIPSCLRLIA